MPIALIAQRVFVPMWIVATVNVTLNRVYAYRAAEMTSVGSMKSVIQSPANAKHLRLMANFVLGAVSQTTAMMASFADAQISSATSVPVPTDASRTKIVPGGLSAAVFLD